MKKAILLLPLVLSLTGCTVTRENWDDSGVPSRFQPVYNGGIYNYKEGETIDILFYFQYKADSVDKSYVIDPEKNRLGIIIYIVDERRYEGGYNYIIIKAMPNISEFNSYYEQEFKKEKGFYCRTILFKIPTSFFKNESGSFWANRKYYNNLSDPKEYIAPGEGLKFSYQKLMNNTKIEIWKNKSQY